MGQLVMMLRSDILGKVQIMTQDCISGFNSGVSPDKVEMMTQELSRTNYTWQGPDHGLLLAQLDLRDEGPLQSPWVEQGALTTPLQYPVEEDECRLLAAVQQLACHVALPCCVAVRQNLDLCTFACMQKHSLGTRQCM